MASPTLSSPLEPTTSTSLSHPNTSSLSISRALSSTPTESPLLDADSPSLDKDDDDDALQAAAQKGRRRSSIQAPGLVQYQPTASLPPTQPDIPGSPSSTTGFQLPTTAGGAAVASEQQQQQQQVGTGEPLLVEFLLVSGKRTRWTVGNEATVREVREAVWRGWPEEWRGQEESPPSAESLRLYLGKFLDDKRTLGSYGLTPTPPTPSPPPNDDSSASPPAPTIIHLNIRPLATEGEYQDDLLKPSKSTNMCGSCCTIS
ncbi:hypothetical protein BCR35DRAFT_139318 [Leucosporidium creatinivorum]|uniref:Ubiquitin-like domain-containing protein n=1 Tax=Leucosporidium creatinivorum TaxID=106004 RepID=A0A1Y2ET99_9BASI|nr:hypothetical protein BCR35DRAFT_139318 [Leucosporidium creatinivorum]